MLQAIVADDDVGLRMRLQQCVAGSEAIASDHDRRAGAAGEHERLVAGAWRVGHLCIDLDDGVAAPAVAARDDAGRPPLRAQRGDDGDDRGRLAGPADHEVADDDDARRQAARHHDAATVQASPHRSDRREDPGKGQECRRHRASRLPEARKAPCEPRREAGVRALRHA